MASKVKREEEKRKKLAQRIAKYFKRKYGIEEDLIDYYALVDTNLTYEENIKNIRKILNKAKKVKSARDELIKQIKEFEEYWREYGKKSYATDKARKAKKVFNLEKSSLKDLDRWLRKPNLYDIRGIDAPEKTAKKTKKKRKSTEFKKVESKIKKLKQEIKSLKIISTKERADLKKRLKYFENDVKNAEKTNDVEFLKSLIRLQYKALVDDVREIKRRERYLKKLENALKKKPELLKYFRDGKITAKGRIIFLNEYGIGSEFWNNEAVQKEVKKLIKKVKPKRKKA